MTANHLSCNFCVCKFSSMKSKLFLTLIVSSFLFMPVSKASAEWINLFKGILEVDIQSLGVDPKNSSILFAASSKNLYQSLDSGENWKKIYGIRGDNEIRVIYIDPFNADAIYIGTEKGIYRSVDAGKHWRGKFKTNFSENINISSIVSDESNRNFLWVGSSRGLFSFAKDKETFNKVESFPSETVQSILDLENSEKQILVSTEKGLYKSIDRGARWQKIESNFSISNEEQSSSLEQFDIEEFSIKPTLNNLGYLKARHEFFALTDKGILFSNPDASKWSKLESGNFSYDSIQALAHSESTFYIGTNKGVYRWDPDKKIFKDLNESLPALDVQDLYYDKNEGFLLAATKKGLYKYSYPEITFKVDLNPQEIQIKSKQILSLFKNEPSIAEVQKAAIEYAEVHPRKIEEWRKAAAKKALMPSVSLNHSVDSDENVDLDRGGTADPDHFITGPQEKSRDWSLGVSWDLGDLIWNNDQTSIDTRSRLMVELRDDVLTEVTHLYYERRRLQVEITLNPPRELPSILEKEIKLEELTASIDALTGGYFSSQIH